MASKRKLGVFWGTNAFHFVETEGGNPKKIFVVPFSSSDVSRFSNPEAVDSLKLITLIQKAIQDQRIMDLDVSLSLPSKDIIFRSFVIPYMPFSEVKNVVEFEASKYVPFSLSELIYTYYPFITVENKKRVIRILLVAIRKDKLEGYNNILERAGLRVAQIEPSSMSVVRALVSRKQLPNNKIIAIVEVNSYEGKIIIVDKNVPQFVREFQLYPSTEDTTSFPLDILRARLFNEIKISFDYFSRQYSQKKIDKIIALSKDDTRKLLDGFSDDFGIPMNLVDVNTILKITTSDEVGLINAFGVGLRDSVTPNINFDIKWKAPQPIVPETPREEKGTDYKSIAITALVSLGLVYFIFAFSNNLITSHKQKIATLKQQLGPRDSLTLEAIEQQTNSFTSKLNNYKNAPPKSEIAYYLKTLPTLFPEGAWIQRLDVAYYDAVANQPVPHRVSRLNINFDGYAYAADASEQFELVDTLLLNLKNNKDFSKTFDKIDLTSVQKTGLQDYAVTSFRITCR
ncbi:MAG: hypothetical protein A2787_08915 [Omnitrophica WOR_2 bacterium RIFCSPHIGHO2_01_FULL_48_9]|nr:MAG: hypothetical protein A2787_08915 [Omnitrophica WOR_2 bacterium RIFCSPHIGHO2_01_FULL_48_9]